MQVNGVGIHFERFVDSFIICTMSGMLASLDDTGPLTDLDLTLERDEIHIILNGKVVEINRFVTKIMKSTLFGMVAPLKGVEITTVDRLDSLHLKISR
jgi:hypothetical protein